MSKGPPIELTSQLNTVRHLAEYMLELKADAHELAGKISTSEQGVFRPNEEEQVLSLLISYWQSRNALMDLVLSIRDDERLYTEGSDGDVLFLVGYTAALLMIDSAHFLRENAHDRPILRRKLNEENREFGIPANVYTTVQKSLVSTRTAWHLYHAIMFYRENEARLLAHSKEDPKLQPLIDIIARLKYRLDRPMAQLQAARTRTRVRHVAGRSKTLLSRALYGIQKLGGIALANRFIKRGHQPGMPAPVCDQVTRLLQPGDVLAVRKEYAITNYFLPGYWPHVALYLGTTDANAPQVLESMKDGVFVRSIASPYASDSVVVLRPQLPAEKIAEALARGLKHEGKRYDFSFDFSRSDRLVCTEVVYRSFDGVDNMKFPLVKRAGRMTLSGNDLVEMGLAHQFFHPIAVYAPMFKPQVFTEQARVEPLVQRCMQLEK